MKSISKRHLNLGGFLEYRFWMPLGCQHGSNLATWTRQDGVKNRHSGVQNRKNMVLGTEKGSELDFGWILDGFGMDFGWILDGFWMDVR